MRDIQINPKKIEPMFQAAFYLASYCECSLKVALQLLFAEPKVLEALRK